MRGRKRGDKPSARARVCMFVALSNVGLMSIRAHFVVAHYVPCRRWGYGVRTIASIEKPNVFAIEFCFVDLFGRAVLLWYIYSMLSTAFLFWRTPLVVIADGSGFCMHRGDCEYPYFIWYRSIQPHSYYGRLCNPKISKIAIKNVNSFWFLLLPAVIHYSVSSGFCGVYRNSSLLYVRRLSPILKGYATLVAAWRRIA